MVDLSGIEHYIPNLAAFLGVDPATALFFVTVLVVTANLVSKFIPDDKTGVLGLIRKITTFIGIAASNRISAGLTVNEIAKTTVPIIEQIGEVQEQMESKLENAAAEVVEAFPGVGGGTQKRDPSTGKFRKGHD